MDSAGSVGKARGNVQFRPCFCCNDTQKWGKTKILGGYPKKEGMGPLASYPEKNDTNCLFTAINFYQAVVFTADDQ